VSPCYFGQLQITHVDGLHLSDNLWLHDCRILMGYRTWVKRNHINRLSSASMSNRLDVTLIVPSSFPLLQSTSAVQTPLLSFDLRAQIRFFSAWRNGLPVLLLFSALERDTTISPNHHQGLPGQGTHHRTPIPPPPMPESRDPETAQVSIDLSQTLRHLSQ